MKKILVLSHTSELVGGAERSIVEVMAILEERFGVKPEFILREPVDTLGPELKRRGWKFHSLPYGFWSESRQPVTTEEKYRKALQNSQAILQIEEIIQDVKPDAVLTNSIVCPWAAFAAYYQRVPHIWFVREYGDLDHGREFDMTRQQTFEDVDTLSNLVIANSQALTNHITQYVPKNKLATLYHPFDTEGMRSLAKQEIKSPFKLQDSLKLVLPAGSVTASKGFLEAVIATGKMNKMGHKTELCLIGQKNEKEFITQLQSEITKYNIADKVHFVGFQKNPMPFVAAADVGIMASRMEAFGRVTFEYMALGKPVVGVATGGTLEMVVDGKNGFHFAYRDTNSLVKALKKYATDKQLIEAHGKYSLKLVDTMLQGEHNIEALYKRITTVITEENTQKRPLHYAHNWLAYPAIAQEYIQSLSSGSIKKLVLKNSKARAKDTAKKVRATYRRRFRT